MMAVNVSARQLAAPEFVEVVAAALADNHLVPGQLCLEITETGMIEEFDRCREALDALAEMGVRLALDDFGTGYSSLAHLRTFRVNTLKIDRSFVEKLGGEGSDGAIVAGVVAMAHALGMDVVAEGVETDEQLRKVMDMECDNAQGFFFARPLSSEMMGRLLADHLEVGRRGIAVALTKPPPRPSSGCKTPVCPGRRAPGRSRTS